MAKICGFKLGLCSGLYLYLPFISIMIIFFDLAKDSHAITSIAHPMKYLKYYNSIKNIEKMILELKNLGLDAVEVFNNRQTIDDEMEIYRFAVENNLAISGGSDYHAKLGSEEKKELGKVLDKTLCKKMITIIK